MKRIIGLIFFASIVLLSVMYIPRISNFSDNFISKPTDETSGIYVPRLSKASFQANENIEVAVKGVSKEDEGQFEIEVKSPEGGTINAHIEEEYVDDEVKFKVIPDTGLTPGKYSVKVIDKAGDKVLLEQDFTWGVLALNTNKSIYTPGEKADIAIAVLNEKGYMVCDAKVILNIKNQILNIDEELSTDKESVRVNPECSVKGYTEKPDYETTFITGGTGDYEMTLTAVTRNGTYTITDSFEVRESVPFEIERITATRIYPPENYPVRLKITANQDFSGKIIEIVPKEFYISKLEDEGIKTYTTEVFEIDKDPTLSSMDLPSDSKVLVWNIEIKKGEEIVIGYIYKSPPKSPFFYMIGPLKLVSSGKVLFEERRGWQIAVDAFEFPTRLTHRKTKSTSSTVSVLLPNGSNVVGYLVIVMFAAGVQGDTTYPNGWTELADAQTGDGNANGSVAYRIIDGTEGFNGTDDSISVTGGGHKVAFAITYTKYGGVPLLASVAGSSADADAPNLSVLSQWGSGKHEWLAFYSTDRITLINSGPANYTIIDSDVSNIVGQNLNAGTGYLYYRQNAASAENPGGTTLSQSEGWFAATIGIREQTLRYTATLKGGITIKGGTTFKP